MRIQITGSRDWDDFHAVENSILGALYDAEAAGIPVLNYGDEA